MEKGKTNRLCPNCRRKMTQQFTGLRHCRCGMSWMRSIGYFERTPGMVFVLRNGKPAIEFRKEDPLE